MSDKKTVQPKGLSRREFLRAAGIAAGAAVAAPVLSACGPFVGGRTTGPVKIGILLPYSDIYAVLGESITAAMEMYFEEVGNEAGGRKIELIKEDTEIKPDVAQQKARKLVEQDEVDLVAGIVSSGVLLALRDYFDANKKLLICANAGANPISRDRKTPYIWRTSFSNWQVYWPLGKWAAENLGKRAFVSIPDYAAGHDAASAFAHNFVEHGGEVVAVQRTPFPNMGDPAPFMAEIAEANPDFVFAFYSGGAAVTFVKAYSDFGLAGKIPIAAGGFMVEEDVLPAEGEAAKGIWSSLHWALLLDKPENEKFKAAYKERVGRDANVFAVQGYDTARVIVEMLNKVEGDTSNVDKMVEALPDIQFNSPRGTFKFDPNTHNVVQHLYLRQVQDVGGELHNVVLEDLGEFADPGDYSKDLKL